MYLIMYLICKSLRLWERSFSHESPSSIDPQLPKMHHPVSLPPILFSPTNHVVAMLYVVAMLVAML